MRTCETMLDLISLRLDGELTPEQEQALAEHLASCPACRALADDLAGIRSVMSGMNVPTPAFIMEHVMERIKGEEEKAVPFPAKRNSTRQWRAWGGIAAALVLVVSGMFVLWGGNETTGGEAMTLNAGMQEPSAALWAYRAAIEGGEGTESVESLPTSESAAVPSCAPSPPPEPADEPAAPNYGGGEAKIAEDAEKPATTATTTEGSAPPQVRTSIMSPPQPEPSAVPSATPIPTPLPTPDNGQQLTGFKIAPSAGPATASHLTVADAARRLYEEKYAERFPDLTLSELEGFIGYAIPGWSLKYVGETQDGTAYEFEEAYFEDETEAVQARYLVPLDGSEIQLLDSGTVE